MTSTKLLVFLGLVCLALTQVDLKTQYCTTKVNTTSEIKMIVEKTGDGSPTEKVLRSQSFVSGTQSLKLVYYEDAGALKLDKVSSSLVTSSEKVTSTLVNFYIDSRDEWVLAREVVDAALGTVVYNLHKYTIGSEPSKTIKLSSTIDSNNKAILDLENWNITKIIEIQNPKIYLIASTTVSTAILSVDTSQSFNTKLEYYVDSDMLLDIVSGNLKAVYDGTCKIFYSFDSTKSVFLPKTFSELQVQSSLIDPVSFIQLSDGVSLAYSTSGTTTSIIQVNTVDVVKATPFQIIGTLKIYTDNYKNVIFVTPTDFIWLRVVSKVVVDFKHSTSTLTAQQKAALLQVLTSNILQVGFDNNLVILMYADTQYFEKASISSLKFDDTTKIVSIVNNEKYLYDFKKDDLTPNSKWTTQQVVQSKFQCNCVSDEVKKIECYDAEMKCIAVTLPKRQMCTKTQA